MDAQTKANLLAWWLQTGVVVLVAAPLPRLLGLWSPRVRMAYWRIVLVGCLLLPLMQPWVVRPAPPAPAVTAVASATTVAGTPRRAGGHRTIVGASSLLEAAVAVRCSRRSSSPACSSDSAGSASASSPSGGCGARLDVSGLGRVRSTVRQHWPRPTRSSSSRPPRAGRSRAACSGRSCWSRARSSRFPSTSRRPSRATNCCTSTGPTGCGTRSTKSCAPRSGSIRPSGG